ncbi:MAG: hypothetical protein WEA75_11035 [Acidimicrobiia bacterium]
MVEKDEPTQQTEQGHEIPVPKRSAWDRLLRKVATPKPKKPKPSSE